jgi:hypothetical protein
MFLRLTCYSLSDWLTRQMVSEKPAAWSRGQRQADHIGMAPNRADLLVSGAFPERSAAGYYGASRCAPRRSVSTESWSTTTPVDIAGWTQVVIQEGQHVLSDVNTGPLAEVNASIDWVLGSVDDGAHRLNYCGGEASGINTCGCPGWSDSNNSRFSCLSFNEVTK